MDKMHSQTPRPCSRMWIVHMPTEWFRTIVCTACARHSCSHIINSFVQRHKNYSRPCVQRICAQCIANTCVCFVRMFLHQFCSTAWRWLLFRKWGPSPAQMPSIKMLPLTHNESHSILSIPIAFKLEQCVFFCGCYWLLKRWNCAIFSTVLVRMPQYFFVKYISLQTVSRAAHDNPFSAIGLHSTERLQSMRSYALSPLRTNKHTQCDQQARYGTYGIG